MERRFRWRRLVQLRLATLLLVVTLCCAVLGFRQAYIAPFFRQQQAVEQLTKAGAAIQYSPARPAWLAPIVGRDVFHYVTWVHMESRGVKDDALVALHDTPYVTNLYLAGNPITDEGLRHVAALRHLQRCSLWRTRITDDGLKHLADLKQLSALDLKNTAVTDEGLAHLVALQSLTELHLPARVSDAGLAHLGRLPKLHTLDASQPRWITPRGLRQLAGCQIQELQTTLAPFRVDELKDLAELRQVTSFRKSRVIVCTASEFNQLSDPMFLARWPELQELQIYAFDDKPLTLDIVAGCEQIDSLRLFDCRVEPGEFAKLKTLPKLAQLTLSLREYDDSFLSGIEKLKHLRWIVIDGGVPGIYLRDELRRRRLSAEMWSSPRSQLAVELVANVTLDCWGTHDLHELRGWDWVNTLRLTHISRHHDLAVLAELESLRNLDLRSANVEHSQWQHIGGLDKLTSLRLDYSNVSDEALLHVSRLANLVQLELNDTLVSDRGMQQLESLTNLNSLYMARRGDAGSGPWITDDGLKPIGRLTNLMNLNLVGLDVTDEGLKHLSQLNRLYRLNLSETAVTSAGLKQLAALKSLRHMTLVGCQIDDEGLETLRQHPGLQYVDLRRTKVTPEAARAHGKQRPQIYVSR
jgi:internalin A